MNKKQAIKVMQDHLGTTHVVTDVDLDSDGDWLGSISPMDNDGEIAGTISIDYDGYSVPYVSWDEY